MGRSVLISGCSTGIGRATALRLDAAGWRVFAGVRKQEDADAIAAAGSERLAPVILDVADSASIDLLRDRLETQAPDGLHGLVNNAGVAYSGPLEFVPLDDFRRQLEVNLIGHLAMTQAMVPALRKTRGRIVNVTSIGGLVATPFFGPYCASKFALEALSDCLRVELRPWGIRTVTVEPGSIATEIWDSGASVFAQMRERMAPEAVGLYSKALEATARASAETGARGIPPERAAEVIERALSVRRPRARYLVGRDAVGMVTGKRLLPATVYDRLTARVLKLP
ncbi:MAG: SDR family oxidoreductase [Solirubrobacterales bacterium]|nr:SDR family oxidoreductase [Solirubrobacterales bacterium]